MASAHVLVVGDVAYMLGLSLEALEAACARAGARVSRTVLRSDVLRIVRSEPLAVILASSLADLFFSADFIAAQANRRSPVVVLVVAPTPDLPALVRLRAAGVPAEPLQPPLGADALCERVQAALRPQPRPEPEPKPKPEPKPEPKPADRATYGPPGPAVAAIATTRNPVTIGENDMANINKTLEEAMKIDGAIAVALADWDSGLCLGTAGGGARLNIEVAAAGNCQVVKAKMATMNELGIKGGIHDILITLDDQVHLIRPLHRGESLFLYVAIDKAKGNLGMARHRLQKLEAELNM